MRDMPLFWKSGDAGRYIDHRLLAHSNEASDRPVEVEDQKYDRPASKRPSAVQLIEG
jgi:hypothetical protein